RRTGSWEGPAKGWDATREPDSRVIAAHTTPVRRVAFSPNGKLLATASSSRSASAGPGGKLWLTDQGDRVVRVWDPATGAPVVALTGHNDHVNSVTFHP